ncbi:ATP-binding protein [Streptomyces sp. NPDC088194]|uniref:ATP-binding protein n=1 Tax=Streptomyces sp. NPDC088194 TaxID=3154931 RepID=UPI00344D1F45
MSARLLHFRLDLACEPSAVRFARSHAHDVLKQWAMPSEVRYDAATVVTELTSNAVRHAGSCADPFGPGQVRPSTVRRCALTLWVTDTRLHLGVWDQSRARPVLRPVSFDAEGGRGLQVVAGLSEGQWGAALTRPEGKVVWAALPLPAGYRPRIARDSPLSRASSRR